VLEETEDGHREREDVLEETEDGRMEREDVLEETEDGHGEREDGLKDSCDVALPPSFLLLSCVVIAKPSGE
jgi:hypothetical protein